MDAVSSQLQILLRVEQQAADNVRGVEVFCRAAVLAIWEICSTRLGRWEACGHGNFCWEWRLS
jgi:hypothetical protein